MPVTHSLASRRSLLIVALGILATGSRAAGQNPSAEKDAQRGTLAVPYVGIAGDGNRWYGGLEIQVQRTTNLAFFAAADGWFFPGATGDSCVPQLALDRERCATGGKNILVGAVGHWGSASSGPAVFAGAGIGLANPGNTHFTTAVRFGVELSRSARVAPSLELRVARVFGALEPTTTAFLAGLHIRL